MSNYRCETVDLRERMVLDLKLIKEHQEFLDSDADVKMMFAIFDYHPLLASQAKYEKDWETFKNHIIEDFNRLKYPPCELEIDSDEVRANWYIPNRLILSGLSESEKELMIKNMHAQLENLTCCKLELLTTYDDGNYISKKEYLKEYYRENQFKNVLLAQKPTK
ncbi:hypothetical protein PD280_07370 [Virgibacillus salarius]|uniref:hypothetical protein n=1 Tax=Virgibacillus salarius TaxID=447199 RepID=UPI00249049AA|nr:hypothetical protein [Virgibacillus salarius]WBX81511.1 hypothetical protein PD280_07370 [Virgibacillus salarius]